MKILTISLLLPLVAAIWPAPQSFTNGTSVVWLDRNIKATYNGRNLHKRPGCHGGSCHGGGHGGGHGGKGFNSEEIVQAAFERAVKTIREDKFVPWKFHPRNQLDQYEPQPRGSKRIKLRTLEITQTTADTPDTFKPLAGAVDESYNFTLGTDGKAELTAVSSTGVLRGLDTFTQLWYLHSNRGEGVYCNQAPISIRDAPRFQHRGLNLDLARSWIPREQVFRQIDALAWNKFNRLHIHMTDAQSWPMDDVEDFHIYATMRGVELIIEFDMPGHTSSIAYSYPELITAFRAEPWDYYCAEPPCGALKLNSSKVYDFLDKLWADVLPRLSPYSAYFHTGGDEVNKNDFKLDETVGSNDIEVIRPFLQKFVDFNHDAVRKAGMTPMVWEEMLLDWDISLKKDVVIQTWQTDEALANATALGYKALFGNYNYWYLDCGRGQWLNFENGPAFTLFYPFLDYCNPLKSWRLMYSYDPVSNLSPEQQALVLGGEMHIWAEQTDAVNLDTMIWPRGGAAGEVLWSGRTDGGGNNRSQVEAAPRLSEWRERLVARGIQAGPVQMIYCTQYGGAECDLDVEAPRPQ